ncbi:TPA: tryptophan--tRNA ligase [Candidatus Delongbacteria bacterium]|nr:MAG: tryptophan--tRNA ligase [Candidatus Delongbacteria bacterium GWF2_40_14]HAQ60996.1 tryptophan--tRNA ligase [Candidatus Delongbacteria bacterium]
MDEQVIQKTILSGIQPTGQLTIGNYIGAMKNFVRLQNDYETLYMVVDLHALTVPQDPKELRHKTLSVIAQYISVGLDPEKNNLFIQSHVTGHTELTWILGCLTGLGDLNRMTQFKDKSSKPGANINAGLYTYPILMASDILLYNADFVPVGEDQKQHVELTRDIAMKFNYRYSDTFTIPEPIIPKSGARIMDLQNPLAKMSKSDSGESGRLALIDEPSVIAKKIKSAVTDSGSEIKFSEDEEKAGIRNLLTIYSNLTELSIADIELKYKSRGYGDFKKDLADIVVEKLSPIKLKHDDLMKNKDYLESVLKSGAESAQKKAWKMLGKVYRKIGLVQAAR